MNASPDEPTAPTPTDLTVEYERAPGNVDPTEPVRFGWRLDTDRRGARQTAYRVVVGRDRERVASGRGDLWDSGRVDADRATSVAYEGPDVASDTTYYWSVKLWTDDGETPWADPTQFVTALEPGEWRGEWIAHQPGPGDTNGWRSRWLDPDDDGDEPWVQVDLGGERTVESVDLVPADPVTVVRTPDDYAVTPSGRDDPLVEFGFPDAYRVEVADEPAFESATVVAEVSDSDAGSPGGEGADAAGQPEAAVRTRTHDADGARGGADHQ